ncbi:MAG: hypothetical protein JXB25_04175 [Deltaproteobacteria bacterium]|nr:hypothetical protein [Deltaproteobacteria bacterium]
MSTIGERTRDEIRQLPRTIARLLGGLAAAFGFGCAAWLGTHGDPAGNLSTALLVGAAGIVVFVLSGRQKVRPTQKAPAAVRARVSSLAWSLLLVFVGLFLAVTWWLTG